MWKKRVRSGLVASVALCFAAIVTPAAAQQGLKLGVLMSMTGGLGSYGEVGLNGVRLAVEEMNAAGGVNGGQVTLAVGDDQTSPQAGVDAAKRLVDIEKVNAIIGALSSGVTIPVATSVAVPAGMIQISTASTSPEITTLKDGDFLFRTVPTDAVQGMALAQIAKEKGVKSAAIIYVNNDYGKGLAEAFAKSFDGKVTQSIAYEPKQASFRGELQRAAQGGADTLLLLAYPEDGIPILKQALEGGFFKKFAFADGMKAPEVAKSIGAKFVEGAFATAPQAAGEASDLFRKLYEKRFKEMPPKPYIDAAYDAAMLVGLAAVKAKSSNPKAIRDALRFVANAPGEPIRPGEFAKAKKMLEAGQDIDYVGAGGPQNFDAAGDVVGTYAHWEFKGGKIVTIKVFEPK
jgi:ABC-type branched-subunit amino acid transport system substrate-binding protein